MINELKRQYEERAKAAAAIKRMADTLTGDKKDFNAEERQAWDRANAEFDDLTRKIELKERAAKVDAAMLRRVRDQRDNPPGLDAGSGRSRRGRRSAESAGERAQALALQGWLMRAAGKTPTKAHVGAARAVGFNLARRTMHVRLPRRSDLHTRALSVGTATAGGHTVPQGFVGSLEKALAAFGGVRNVADVLRTDSGASLPWPTANDTGNTGELLSENTDAADAGADPTFGQVTFGAYKYSSKVVRVSYELIEDSAFRVAEEIGFMLGERLGRVQAGHLATGTGSGQPQGVVTGSSLGKTAASATAIAGDELIDLVHSVNTAYRSGPDVAFLMADSTLAAIRKLKDGQGNYLWQMGNVQVGAPDRLLGYPVYVDHGMPAIATGNKTVLFGPMKKFKIRDVNSVRLKRLDERYAERDQVGFIAFMRTDAKMLTAGSSSPIKHLVQA